jgi:hypothetical protein
MSYHIYAVRDFMDLLKALQHKYSPSGSPWKGDANPKAARFINEILIDEESDICPKGHVMSHYEMYRRGMVEIGAQNANKQEAAVQGFVQRNKEIANIDYTAGLVVAFYYGREKLIPAMFTRILEAIDHDASPYFTYYLKRHVECDEEDHGPRAKTMMVDQLRQLKEPERLLEDISFRVLGNREQYWDYIYGKIMRNKGERNE